MLSREWVRYSVQIPLAFSVQTSLAQCFHFAQQSWVGGHVDIMIIKSQDLLRVNDRENHKS